MGNFKSIQIKIKTQGMIADKFDSEFVIEAIYSDKETIGNILTRIEKEMNRKYTSTKLKVTDIEGFTGSSHFLFFCG